jgi:hypothetical protein
MVGVRGFEPPAPASRRQCSTRLSYTPTGTGVVINLRSAPGKPLRLLLYKQFFSHLTPQSLEHSPIAV